MSKWVNHNVRPEYLYWYEQSVGEVFSEQDIREQQQNVLWNQICIYQTLSEPFIEEFQNFIWWYNVSKYQTLSESFIEKFKKYLSFNILFKEQILSESFIRAHQDEVEWYFTSKYQTLSELFIREFQHLVRWDLIPKYQTLSESFIKEFNLTIPETNWLYWTCDQKRDYIQTYTPYEVDRDCLYAYKATFKYGKSIYKPSIRYTVGQTYSVPKVDCNMDVTDSFGLSAWTKKKAISYHDDAVECNAEGELYRVKIHLNDLGCITKDGKIRCKQLTFVKEV